MIPTLRRAAGGLALIVVIVGAFWIHRVHLQPPSRPVIDGMDLIFHFYPTTAYLHRELGEGRLPLWNPYQMAGQPFLALHVTAALYPPNLVLAALLPPGRAIEAHAVFHLIVAGFFTWLFAGRIGLGLPARLAASLAYALSAEIVVGAAALAPLLAVHVWLPAILWAVHGLLSETRRRWALALGVFVGFSFLAGYAQGLYYELQLALAYGIFGLVTLAKPGTRARAVVLALSAGLLALAMAAPQLLPTLELTAQSVRTLGGLTLEETSIPHGRPGELLRGLLPFRGWTEWSRATVPMLALPLAIVGLWARGKRGLWIFFAVAAVLSWLFVLGPSGVVHGLLYYLPLGATFRGPLRMLFVFHFTMAILLALGVQSVQDALARRRLAAWLPVAVATALALVVGADNWARARFEAAHPAIAAVPGAPSDLVKHLQSRPGRDRVFVQTWGLGDEQLMKKLGMMHGVFAVPDYEANMPAVYERFLTDGQQPTWHGDLSLAPFLGRDPVIPNHRALDLMSVRYYAALRSPDEVRLNWALSRFAPKRAALRKDWQLHERPNAVRRAYVVEDVVYAPDVDSAIERALSPTFRPLRQAVVVGDESASAFTGKPSAGKLGQAEITEYEADDVTLSAECARPCLLVLTDLDYPGWQAEVDGEDAEIVRTNGLFRGLWLEPGTHEVEYRYRPRSFTLGLWITAASLIACAAILVAAGRARS